MRHNPRGQGRVSFLRPSSREHAIRHRTASPPHRRNTLRSVRDHQVVLLIQDTTELNFGPTGSREGLGLIGYGGVGAGLQMHSTLALTPGVKGIVLGVAQITIWARTLAPVGESKTARRARSDRESMRWNKAILEVGTPPDGTRWIHVGDRERGGERMCGRRSVQRSMPNQTA